jgi:hypothetical protein
MDALAYEFSVTGKPNPNYAVYANGVEFDWYRVDSQGNVILMDAKNYTERNLMFLDPNMKFVENSIAEFITNTQRQITAANGRPVELIFPDIDVSNRILDIIRTNTTLSAAYDNGMLLIVP